MPDRLCKTPDLVIATQEVTWCIRAEAHLGQYPFSDSALHQFLRGRYKSPMQQIFVK